MSEPVRQRRRAITAAGAGAAATASGQSGGTWGRRGSAIAAEAAKAQASAERKRSGAGSALRFYVKGGDDCEIIILDHSIEDGLAFYEHNLQGADGKWDIYEPCIKDFAQCPICARFKESSYVLMLTCLVLKPFTTKKGVVVPHSKMLLPVRITQFDKFRDLEASAKSEGGSLRGMYLIMKRSKSDSKAARIGEPAMLEGGKLYDLIPEAELVRDYGHKEVRSEDGTKVFRPANFDITPYDYDELFPKPDVKDIQTRYGADMRPPAGSAREVAAEFEENEQKEQPEETAKPAATVRTRRKAAPTADSNPFPED
jgi:hypothetical protein